MKEQGGTINASFSLCYVIVTTLPSCPSSVWRVTTPPKASKYSNNRGIMLRRVMPYLFKYSGCSGTQMIFDFISALIFYKCAVEEPLSWLRNEEHLSLGDKIYIIWRNVHEAKCNVINTLNEVAWRKPLHGYNLCQTLLLRFTYDKVKRKFGKNGTMTLMIRLLDCC